MNLWLDTLKGLAAPRRAIPILALGLPLLYAQARWALDPQAQLVGVVLVVSTLLLAPASWRALFPLGKPVPWLWLRVLAYGALGLGVVWVGAMLLPALIESKQSLLTNRTSLPVEVGLFWVGGFGLARDIELERQIERETARADALARDRDRAMLLAVRAHLDPHFLFNTLNAIAEWCATDALVAERAIVQLATILRTLTSALPNESWTLGEELGLARQVLDLYRIRDPERYASVVDVSEGLDLELSVPPLFLLPLIENAFKHGPAKGHEGPIRVEARREGRFGRVEVSNPGPWGGPREGGEGLALTRRRLEVGLGVEATLEVGPVNGARSRALVSWPLGGAT